MVRCQNTSPSHLTNRFVTKGYTTSNRLDDVLGRSSNVNVAHVLGDGHADSNLSPGL